MDSVKPNLTSTLHIDKDGTKRYFLLDGKTLHRVDGPAIEYINGTKVWLFNGKHHRTDGPAIEWNDGDKEWYFNGKLHRVDGPAIEYGDGDKEYYLNGVEYSFEKWNKLRKMLWML